MTHTHTHAHAYTNANTRVLLLLSYHNTTTRALRKAVDIYTQLEGHLQSLGLPIKSAGNDPVPVCRALTAGD